MEEYLETAFWLLVGIAGVFFTSIYLPTFFIAKEKVLITPSDYR